MLLHWLDYKISILFYISEKNAFMCKLSTLPLALYETFLIFHKTCLKILRREIYVFIENQAGVRNSKSNSFFVLFYL